MQDSAKLLLRNSYQYESIEQGDSNNLSNTEGTRTTSRSSVAFYGMVVLVITMAVVLLSGGSNIKYITPKVELPAQAALGLGQVMLPGSFLESSNKMYRAANYNNDLVIYKNPNIATTPWPSSDSTFFSTYTPFWKLSELLKVKSTDKSSCFYGHFPEFYSKYQDLSTIGPAKLASKGKGAALLLSWTNNVPQAGTSSQAMPSYVEFSYNSTIGSLTDAQKLAYKPTADADAIFFFDLNRNANNNFANVKSLKFVMQTDGNLVILPATSTGVTTGYKPYFASNWGSNSDCCTTLGYIGGSASLSCTNAAGKVAPYY